MRDGQGDGVDLALDDIEVLPAGGGRVLGGVGDLVVGGVDCQGVNIGSL